MTFEEECLSSFSPEINHQEVVKMELIQATEAAASTTRSLSDYSRGWRSKRKGEG